MVSLINNLWPDDGLIEEKPKHVVNFKLDLAINNINTSCIWLLYPLIIIILWSVDLPAIVLGLPSRWCINPLNAELNPICHLVVLLGDLTFMGPCIVSIFQNTCISNKMQSYTVYLYLETALHVSVGTSTHHQERIQLYLQHLVFVTPLPLPAGSSNGVTNARCCRYSCMRSWWWVEVPPETCRTVSRCK
jgi:hypothetical protein